MFVILCHLKNNVKHFFYLFHKRKRVRVALFSFYNRKAKELKANNLEGSPIRACILLRNICYFLANTLVCLTMM